MTAGISTRGISSIVTQYERRLTKVGRRSWNAQNSSSSWEQNDNNIYFCYSTIPTASLLMGLYSLIIIKKITKIKIKNLN